MDKRTTGIIATVVSALLCGCSSLFLCIFGFGTVTGNGTYNLGSQAGNMPPTIGYVFLCLSVILILVPVAVGFFTLRKKPEAVPASNEKPIPPAS